MTSKNSKRSYYLPDNLVEYFAQWCHPGRDYSTKIAGAMLVYMALPSELREAAEKAAHADNIKKTILDIRTQIEAALVQRRILEFLASLTDEQRTQVLADLKVSKDKLAHKK